MTYRTARAQWHPEEAVVAAYFVLTDPLAVCDLFFDLDIGHPLSASQVELENDAGADP